MKSSLPQDWKEYTIGDCLRRVEHPVEVDSDALYTQIGICSHGKGLFYKEPVTGESLGNKAVYWVEPNCFILNIVFAWEQAIGKTTQAEVGMIGSHRFPMYKPVNNLVDIDYLVYYLLTKRGTDILEAASPGGAGRNRTLGQDRFMKSKIVLPPLDEQKKIAEILATQDKAIELQGRKIEELKRFKNGCLEKMFPRKGQKVPEKRFPGFTDDWEQRKVSDVAEICTGGTPSTGIEKYWYPKEIPWLSSGEVHKKYITYTDNKISVEGMNNSSARMIPENSVLIALAGQGKTRGTVAINRIPLTTNQSIAAMAFSNEVVPEFVFCNLESRYEEIRRMSSGDGSRGGLNKQIIGEMEIPYTSKEEQTKIGAYFFNLDNLITLHQRKLEEMKNQKKALMQLLLTGIVRVRL